MPAISDSAVRMRAFQLADRDGYIWEPSPCDEELEYQPALDDEQRHQYFEWARADLAHGA